MLSGGVGLRRGLALGLNGTVGDFTTCGSATTKGLQGAVLVKAYFDSVNLQISNFCTIAKVVEHNVLHVCYNATPL
jgi:hypothetical protein